MDNVADRLWDERRLESFFESGIFGFVELLIWQVILTIKEKARLRRRTMAAI